MTNNTVIFIPISAQLYNDIIRFSDGAIDPAAMAATQLENWIQRDVEFGDDNHWGDRLEDVAKVYAPHFFKELQDRESEFVRKAGEDKKPLVWKEVCVPSGSDVRMSYDGTHHYAAVKGGKIVDKDGAFSPSEWASKVAVGTSRNAWRDLWFREPFSKNWIPAELLRHQAVEESRKPLPSLASSKVDQ